MHSETSLFRIKEAADRIAVPLYRLRGAPPWSPGYYTTKKNAIIDGIASRTVRAGNPLPASYGIGLDERVVEYPWMFDRLLGLPNGVGTMLDAGSTLNHDFVLANDPLRKADLTMMTLAPEKRCYWHDGYSYVFGDFRQTKFKDGAFDTIVSISTLEHVGLDNTMLYTSDVQKAESTKNGFVDAIREFRRIIAPGGHCLISVPYGRYEDFKWFHVFDRGMLKSLLDEFAAAYSEIQFFKYNSNGWTRATQADTDDATAFDPHSGRGKTDDRAGCARGLACIHMVA